MQAFEWMIARRYLTPRRKDGFISLIAGLALVGIALGVATLIVVMSVMNGFRYELLGRILGLNGHIMVQGYQGGLPDYDALAKQLRQVAGVRRVTPIIEGQVMAMANNTASGALVRGLRPADLKKMPIIADNIRAGDLADFTGRNAVVVGDKLAHTLGLTVGDNITLVAPQGTFTAFGTAPRLQAYTIVATFDIGMYEYDSGFIFMPLEEAQIYFRQTGRVSGLEVMIDDPDKVAAFHEPLLRLVAGRGVLVDWRQINSGFFTALQVERNVMFLILTLIILVAAFNIVSSLIMLVKDKGADIAILRTMGATRGAVMRVFFIAGASVGVLGTLSGSLLGVLFCDNIEPIRRFFERLTDTNLFSEEIYFLSELPARMDPVEVVSVILAALALSFLATLYPSWRAARMDPVEALRHE
jgi:lipoprotein-releasing system permease protein